MHIIHLADECLCRFDCLLCELTNAKVLQQVMVLSEDSMMIVWCDLQNRTWCDIQLMFEKVAVLNTNFVVDC